MRLFITGHRRDGATVIGHQVAQPHECERAAAEQDDDLEATARARAFIKRMIRPGGALPPGVDECARPLPKRHWRSYGNEPLPTDQEALGEPFAAFPSWFMRITCDRCGENLMISETHMKRGYMPIRDILHRMRHDGCGGRAGKAELLTGLEGEHTLMLVERPTNAHHDPTCAGRRRQPF